MTNPTAAYREKFTAPVPNPVGEPSAWWGPSPHWRGTKAIEWEFRRSDPLYDYFDKPCPPDAPLRFIFKRKLSDGAIKVILTQQQLQRAARAYYGIEP